MKSIPRIPMRVQYPYLYSTEFLRQQMTTLDERRQLSWARGDGDSLWRDEDNPLVTVRVATYGRGRLVVDRAVRSALAQTHENIEVVVVGDDCEEETVQAMSEVTDPRVRFLNLPARGLYPQIPHLRRKVAGAHPMNVGNLLARGSWITPCDDDDTITEDHVEALLEATRERRLEMVYSKADDEGRPGEWGIVGKEPLARGDISHGSVLMRSELRFMPYSMTCWKMREPADWNMWKRMQSIGVRIGFLDQVTYRHHLSEAGRTLQSSDTPMPEAGVVEVTSGA